MEELDDEHHQSVFKAYHVQDNTTRKLFALPLPNAQGRWNISPDGSRLAMLQPTLHNGTIQIRLLNGALEREIKVKGWNDFEGVDWAADGKSLVLGVGTLNVTWLHNAGALLRTDMQGNVQLLWSRTGASDSLAIHSPDGKHLAMLDDVANRNVWLFEGF